MVINSKIQQKRGGGKYHSPMVLHGKITMGREIPMNIIMWMKGQVKT